MKVIDLLITNKYKVRKDIDVICGGQSPEYKVLNGFSKGLGGFVFTDHHSGNEMMRYKATIAFFDKGMGLYCRNMYKNFLTLIPEEELQNIHVYKYPDIVRPAKYSLYKWMVARGRPSYIAEKYLMPIEIIEEHLPQTIIKLPTTEINLTMEDVSIDKMKKILGRTKYRDLLTWDIAEAKERK